MADEKFNLHKKVLESMIEALNRQVIPWDNGMIFNPNPKNDGEKGLIRNGDTNAPYSELNQAFLISQMVSQGRVFKDRRFYTLKSLGNRGTVKKGEKSFIITFNCKYYRDKDGKIVTDEEVKKMTPEQIKELQTAYCLRYYRVFNFEQIEWKAEQVAKPVNIPPPMEVLEVLSNYGERSGVNLEIIDDKAITPLYDPNKDEVRINNTGFYKSTNAWSHAIFHEMAHSTGCHKRLKRYANKDFDQASRSREELVAELAACFLQQECGLHVDVDNSAEYCRGWSEWLQQHTNDTTIFTTAMGQAVKAKKYIIG